MDKTNQWQKEIVFLESIISKMPLLKTIKWGTSVYTLNNQNVIGVSGFKSYVGLWFYKGVFLSDKKKLLINAQEGVTKSLRQMRFKSINEIDEAVLIDYITEAIEIEKAGLTIPKTKKVFKIPTLLLQAFEENKDLELAFLQFANYKQNDFIEYIDSAKQEKTKIDRLEKIKPMILSNIGLNDKFKK